ncbi:hypothetical protein [Streptomyces hainanensis]|uniref:Uncharacterized protein n=1 Tax=Streptomyces hainanensis TaxID=402648 RepID=A0A4R4T5M9_9ACTN|nr:hypothetical protein [Streptomyces hainanensis]TDC72348.1 hypothetical protein E1283_21965 [Streptomyces hainanensis]
MRHDMHEIDGPGEFEREFGAMLHQAGGGFQPDSQVLAEGGLRRGRIRLWRRRAAMVTGAAAVAAVAVAAVQLPGGGGGGENVFDVADTPENRSDLIATLTAMLPEGLEVTDSMAFTPTETGDPSVSLSFGEGPGDLTLDVSMLRWQAKDWRSEAGCWEILDPETESCEETELDDGSVLSFEWMSFSDAELGAEAPDADAREINPFEGEEGAVPFSHYQSWRATLESPTSWGPEAEGLRQIVVSLDSTGEGAADPGVEPPLSQDLLEEIAQAPVWGDVLAVADAEHGAPDEWLDLTTSDSEVPGDQLLSIFGELAPADLEISEEEPRETGTASLTVGRGEASAQLGINAYDSGFGLDSGPTDDPSCEVREPHENGTQIFLCDYALEDSLSQYFVDVYYPNGASVDFQLLFEEGAGSPLTLEEIGEIAGGQQWQDLFD